MAKNLGIGLIIGATLSSSIGTAFASVENKIRQTRQAMGGAAREARVMQKALDLRTRRDDLSARYKASGGRDKALRSELARISGQYHKARTAALAYGGSVADWSRKHADAARQLEVARVRLARFEGMREQAATRRELRGKMVEAVAPLAIMGMPVRMAMDFESGMADAAKTIDGMRDDAGNLTPQYYEMEAAVKTLGRALPLTHKEIAGLFAAGGQQGMTGVKELTGLALPCVFLQMFPGRLAFCSEYPRPCRSRPVRCRNSNPCQFSFQFTGLIVRREDVPPSRSQRVSRASTSMSSIFSNRNISVSSLNRAALFRLRRPAVVVRRKRCCPALIQSRVPERL